MRNDIAPLALRQAEWVDDDGWRATLYRIAWMTRRGVKVRWMVETIDPTGRPVSRRRFRNQVDAEALASGDIAVW